jgi:hypothetical protein
MLEFTPPGVEAGFAQVAGTEGADGETAALPELNPALPLLFFAWIAGFAVSRRVALLSEDIAPRLSRTLLVERTPSLFGCASGFIDRCAQ